MNFTNTCITTKKDIDTFPKRKDGDQPVRPDEPSSHF